MAANLTEFVLLTGYSTKTCVACNDLDLCLRPALWCYTKMNAPEALAEAMNRGLIKEDIEETSWVRNTCKKPAPDEPTNMST